MCRIALYASGGGAPGLEKLLKCFVRGSLKDFMLRGFAGGHGAHTHGWGYAYVYSSPNGMGIGFYRTSEPISYSGIKRTAIPKKPFGWILMILHSRLASDGPINVFNSHPYHFRGSGISLWLAHNGSVDKHAIVRELGVNEDTERYSDSYFLTQWIGRRLGCSDSSSIKDAVRKAIELGLVRSSLNFVAVVADEVEDRVMGVAVNHVSEDYAYAFEYYRLYTVRIDVNALVVASSTVALYLNKLYGLSAEPLDNNAVVFVYPYDNSVRVDVEKLW